MGRAKPGPQGPLSYKEIKPDLGQSGDKTIAQQAPFQISLPAPTPLFWFLFLSIYESIPRN